MIRKTLSEVVSKHPFPEYARWWPMGNEFLKLMSAAIVEEWAQLPINSQDLGPVQVYLQLYLEVVYNRVPRPDLVVKFADLTWKQPLQSGEFDALSYAFFRSAFELISAHPGAFPYSLNRERHLFTVRVGRRFFSALSQLLALDLPEALETAKQFKRLRDNIRHVGDFLQEQKYLRDNFEFRYDVDVLHEDRRIQQTSDMFLDRLLTTGIAFALYEMGYPAILPSAVYLYQTHNEAQHHSSRTIEELFAQVGCLAHETADFDPTGFPANKVVELWEIHSIPAPDPDEV